jgi:hypothetical protein
MPRDPYNDWNPQAWASDYGQHQLVTRALIEEGLPWDDGNRDFLDQTYHANKDRWFPSWLLGAGGSDAGSIVSSLRAALRSGGATTQAYDPQAGLGLPRDGRVAHLAGRQIYFPPAAQPNPLTPEEQAAAQQKADQEASRRYILDFISDREAAIRGRANPYELGGDLHRQVTTNLARTFGGRTRALDAELAARGQLGSGLEVARLGQMYGYQAGAQSDLAQNFGLQKVGFEDRRQDALNSLAQLKVGAMGDARRFDLADREFDWKKGESKLNRINAAEDRTNNLIASVVSGGANVIAQAVPAAIGALSPQRQIQTKSTLGDAPNVRLPSANFATRSTGAPRAIASLPLATLTSSRLRTPGWMQKGAFYG